MEAAPTASSAAATGWPASGNPGLEPGVTAGETVGHQGLGPGYGAGWRPGQAGGSWTSAQAASGVAGSSGEPWPLLLTSPGLTFFMLPRVTVERALDISRGLRPRNSPIFPSTCTMYLAKRKQGWQCHASPDAHSKVTVTDGRSVQEPGSNQAPPTSLAHPFKT